MASSQEVGDGPSSERSSCCTPQAYPHLGKQTLKAAWSPRLLLHLVRTKLLGRSLPPDDQTPATMMANQGDAIERPSG